MNTPEGTEETPACIRHSHSDLRNYTWCEERCAGFVFQSVDHAAYSLLAKRRIPVCPKCLDRISKLLR